MNRQQKKKLNDVLLEVNAPDKDRLLDRIEQRKNFSEDFKTESEYAKKKKHKTTALAVGAVLSLALCVFIVVSVFSWICKAFSDEAYIAGGGTVVDGERYEDHRNGWKIKFSSYISFDDTDITYEEFCKHNEIDEFIPAYTGWSVVRSQITQDEGSYREYRTNGEEQIEISVFADGKIPSLDKRYEYFINSTDKAYADGKVWYVSELMLQGTDYRYAYVYYAEDAIYCMYSTFELMS